MPRIRIIERYIETQESWIREGWERLLSDNNEGTLFYQSPPYFDHLASCICGDEVFLAIAECGNRNLRGVVPLRRTATTLDFEAKDQYFLRISFSGLKILGGNLLLPPDLYDAMFSRLTSSFSDCNIIEIRGIRTESALWDYLNKNPSWQRQFMLYAPDGPRWCHTINVPDSYEDYISLFKRKKRYNLTRQVRCMEQWSNGRLSLHRVRATADLQVLQKALFILGRDENGLDDKAIFDLAQRGLLLTYVLQSGTRPCALAFGTIFKDTLLIHVFKHDRQLDHLSPGTVLHILLIKDLIEAKLVRRIDYGFGEPKSRLSTGQEERITVFLIRKTLLNSLAVMAHKTFRELIKWMKRFFG